MGEQPNNEPNAGQPNPTSDKMVPEKDLLAVKSALSKKESEFTEKLNASHTELLKVQGELEAANAKLTERDKIAEELANVTKDRDALKTRAETLESSLTESEAQRFARDFNVDPEKLKGKTPEELKVLREAASLIGKPSVRHDAGASGSGAASPPADKIRAGLAELDKK